MSTGNISLDILLNQIQGDALSKSKNAVGEIRRRYPALTLREAEEIHALVCASQDKESVQASLVVTAPPSFAIRSKVTKVVIENMLNRAQRSILITGYSLSDYFSDLIEVIIKKSQQGVLVKFYVNDIQNQHSFDRLFAYKGHFLKIYNYPKREDSMSALHAKVISVDQRETLITSANLSYHGQEGNVEVGTHIVSRDIANQIEQLFTQLLFSKVFEEFK